MAKLPRVFLERYGKDGVTNDFSQFGSKAAAAPVKTKNIATIQGLDAWKNGIKDALLAGVKAPFLEDVNGWMLVISYMMAYLFEAGVPEWEANTTYFIGSIVRAVGTDEQYSSKTDNNQGNTLPSQQDDANWRFLGAGVVGYRRPVLQWNNVMTVDVEAQTGTANQTKILFPDGTVRTVTEDLGSTQKYRRFDITKTAEFTSGTESGGLRSGLSEAQNTWYALYAVKSNINPANFVIVGDTTLPLAANFATLNGRYTTNGWIYLGMIRNGANCGDSGLWNDTIDVDIIKFIQKGNVFKFLPYDTHPLGPTASAAVTVDGGLFLGYGNAGPSVLSVTLWAYSAGVGTAQIPDHLDVADFRASSWGDGSPAFANVYYNGVSDPPALFSSANYLNLQVLLQEIFNGGTPSEIQGFLTSYRAQIPFYKSRISVSGPKSATQQSIATDLHWPTQRGLAVFAGDSGNFVDNLPSTASLMGWEDSVLASGLNNAI